MYIRCFYDDWSGMPPALGIHLGVAPDLIESPFWHSLAYNRRVHCLFWSHVGSERSSLRDVTKKGLREKPWDPQHKAALQGKEQLLRVISL